MGTQFAGVKMAQRCCDWTSLTFVKEQEDRGDCSGVGKGKGGILEVGGEQTELVSFDYKTFGFYSEGNEQA